MQVSYISATHMQNPIMREIKSDSSFGYILADDSSFSSMDYKVLQNQNNGLFIECVKVLYNGKTELYYITEGLRSLALMVKDMTPDMDSPIADYEYYVQVFGDLNKVAETHINPLVQVRLLNEAGKDIPPLYLACGTEDFGYEMNTKFAEDLKQAGVDVEFHCGSGQHNWAFWNTWFEPAIKWLLK